MGMQPDPEKFAVEYVRNNAQGTAAALFAGYAESTAVHQVSRILSLPIVQATIARELGIQRAVSGTIGLYVLQEVARSAAFPAAARCTAARTLMEYAGLIGAKGDPGASKDPSEMTTAELHATLARIDREIGDRAKPVNGPMVSPIPDEVAEFLS